MDISEVLKIVSDTGELAKRAARTVLDYKGMVTWIGELLDTFLSTTFPPYAAAKMAILKAGAAVAPNIQNAFNDLRYKLVDEVLRLTGLDSIIRAIADVVSSVASKFPEAFKIIGAAGDVVKALDALTKADVGAFLSNLGTGAGAFLDMAGDVVKRILNGDISLGSVVAGIGHWVTGALDDALHALGIDLPPEFKKTIGDVLDKGGEILGAITDPTALINPDKAGHALAVAVLGSEGGKFLDDVEKALVPPFILDATHEVEKWTAAAVKDVGKEFEKAGKSVANEWDKAMDNLSHFKININVKMPWD
jgi:hypothetical protein